MAMGPPDIDQAPASFDITHATITPSRQRGPAPAALRATIGVDGNP
jgi:hypothetical protein